MKKISAVFMVIIIALLNACITFAELDPYGNPIPTYPDDMAAGEMSNIETKEPYVEPTFKYSEYSESEKKELEENLRKAEEYSKTHTESTNESKIETKNVNKINLKKILIITGIVFGVVIIGLGIYVYINTRPYRE